MAIKLEVCLDNYESLLTAHKYGADRIELCASLKEGGLTPPLSFIEVSQKLSVPVFVIIRPRGCDFLYSCEELEMMHNDIHTAKKLGIPGVVFGVLKKNGDIDKTAMKSLIRESSGMEVTCHRAIDQVPDIYSALDTLLELGVNRILTSGQAKDARDGIPVLKKLVEQSKGRLSVMPSMQAGETAEDVRKIIIETGVHEVHAPAVISRKSNMEYVKSDAEMGDSKDFSLNIVDGEKIKDIKEKIKDL